MPSIATTGADTGVPESSTATPVRLKPHVWEYALPVVLLAAALIVYLISPEFYLRYVLEEQMREYQAVEMLTFGMTTVATGLLAVAAVRVWRLRPPGDYGPTGARGLPDRHGAYGLVAIVALAALFFAGEEVNWGQTFVNWGQAENQQDYDVVVNLHNTFELVSIQSLGSLFLIVVFFGIPLAWVSRKRLNLPAAWAPAIASGPAVFAALCAFAISKVKDLYVAAVGDVEGDAFYLGYIEQAAEQKEMLIGAALLLMAIGVLRKLKAEPDWPVADPS